MIKNGTGKEPKADKQKKKMSDAEMQKAIEQVWATVTKEYFGTNGKHEEFKERCLKIAKSLCDPIKKLHSVDINPTCTNKEIFEIYKLVLDQTIHDTELKNAFLTSVVEKYKGYERQAGLSSIRLNAVPKIQRPLLRRRYEEFFNKPYCQYCVSAIKGICIGAFVDKMHHAQRTKIEVDQDKLQAVLNEILCDKLRLFSLDMKASFLTFATDDKGNPTHIFNKIIPEAFGETDWKTLNSEKYRRLHGASLNALLDDGKGEFQDTIAVAPSVHDSMDIDALNSAIDSLDDDREKRIIRDYFLQGETLERVGENNAITKERVRQIKNVVLKKLRNKLGDDFDPSPFPRSARGRG